MSVAPRLRSYLDHSGIDYEVLPHPRTESSLETARVAHVAPHQLAKAVLLEDERGYVMAVVPASRRIDLGRLRAQLHRELEFATEQEIPELFDDCEPGALPPIGSAYRVPTIYDDTLRYLHDVYFEAGQHTDVVHMNGTDFMRVVVEGSHAKFSRAL